MGSIAVTNANANIININTIIIFFVTHKIIIATAYDTQRLRELNDGNSNNITAAAHTHHHPQD